MSWDILRRVDAPNTTIDNRPAITRFGRNHSRNIAAPEREFIQETIAVNKYFGGAASLFHHGVPHHDDRLPSEVCGSHASRTWAAELLVATVDEETQRRDRSKNTVLDTHQSPVACKKKGSAMPIH